MKRSPFWSRRLVTAQPSEQSAVAPMLETLEHRVLFVAPHPTNIIADNRGAVIIQPAQPLQRGTLKARNTQMQTAGPDGILGNGDDQKVETRVRWRASTTRVVILCNALPADTTSRIRMNAKT